MKTILIGYGSTLRCDDGVGYMLADQLLQRPMADGCEVIARQQLTPDLADDLSRCEQVIFVDACAHSPPGEIRRTPVTPGGSQWGAFVHEMAPDVLLDCIADIYKKTPKATLITIGGECFDIGEGLTAKVQAALEQLVTEFGALLCKDAA